MNMMGMAGGLKHLTNPSHDLCNTSLEQGLIDQCE